MKFALLVVLLVNFSDMFSGNFRENSISVCLLGFQKTTFDCFKPIILHQNGTHVIFDLFTDLELMHVYVLYFLIWYDCKYILGLCIYKSY